MSTRRRRPKRRSSPYDSILGRIGLERHLDRGGKDAELAARDEKFRRTETVERNVVLAQRQAPIVVGTLLDVIVLNPSGSTIGRTTLASVPTQDATVSFPFGLVTIVTGATPTPNLPLPGLTSNLQSTPSPSTTDASSTGVPSVTSSPLPTSFTTAPPAANSSPSNSTSTSSRSSSSADMGLMSFISNSTISSSSSLVPSSSSSSSFSLTFSTSTTSSSSRSVTGLIATATGDGSGSGAAPTDTQPAPAATTAAAASSGSSVNAPVVGGVVGGLAGLALIFALILFLLRWRKRKFAGTRQLSSGADGEVEPAETGNAPSGPMTQRVSSWGAAGLVIKKMRPNSEGGATSETAPSERGFQKISGRKLESVLTSGGDGYGTAGPSNRQDRNMSGSSFFRDSPGTSLAVGPASQRPSVAASSLLDLSGSPPPPSDTLERGLSASPPDTTSPSPPPDAIIMRPGPARQPVHQQGFGRGETPPPALSPLPPRIRQDGIGRSHPSFDGSRDSRGSRFAEDFT